MDPEQPTDPEVPTEVLVEFLKELEAERQKAIDLAWKQFEQAEGERSQRIALNNVARMMNVLEYFRNQFPTVFWSEND